MQDAKDTASATGTLSSQSAGLWAKRNQFLGLCVIWLVKKNDLYVEVLLIKFWSHQILKHTEKYILPFPLPTHAMVFVKF